MEAGWPDSWAGSFAEIGIKLILHAKNCLVKRVHTAESTYVILKWHVTQKELWNEFLFVLTPTWLQTSV